MLWDELVEFLQRPDTWSGPGSVWVRVWEHLWVSIASVLIAAVLVVPLALWLGHLRRGTNIAAAVVNVGRAAPSFGILAVAFMVFVALGGGVVGKPWPVLIALVALAAPPLFTNTVAGIESVPRPTLEAARGMGLTGPQTLTSVEIPLAAPVMMEGLRIALVQVIATATLGAFVAWGGLGRLIVDGFASQDLGRIFFGAVLVAALAVVAELGMSRLGTAVESRNPSSV